jgi:hypothetical protein
LWQAKKGAAKNKCTSVVGHFDGRGGVPKQYRRHCPMQHVQGYLGSHWTPPSGNYLLRIAPAAARATANKTTKKWTNFAGNFDGHGGAPVQYCVHCPVEKVPGFGRSHWTMTLGEYCTDRCNWSASDGVFLSFFIVNS